MATLNIFPPVPMKNLGTEFFAAQGLTVNRVLVTAGVLIVLFARQLLADEGARAAAIFLGGSMCISVLFRVVMPIFDRLVGDSCRLHYLKLHEEYVRAQEARIKQMEEEIYKNRKRSDATPP